MINFRKLLLAIFVCFTICSCGSYKNVPYFQDAKLNSKEAIGNYSPLTVQSQDILGINVTSLNPESSAIFNTNQNRANGNNYDTNPNNPIVGYLVDQNGNIQLPVVGTIKAAGLTTAQVQEQILTKVSPILKGASVTVRLMNFKVSVLGDVGHPGVYPVNNERITIPEALGAAGDLNITALRTNVMLIREVNGERSYIPIDLTSKDLFNSPYYYLKNNDLLVVQPGKTKVAKESTGFQTGTLLLSALSIVAIVFSTLHR